MFYHNTEELEKGKGRREGGRGEGRGGGMRGGEDGLLTSSSSSLFGVCLPFLPSAGLGLVQHSAKQEISATPTKPFLYWRSLPSNTGINNFVDHFYIVLFSAL